MKQRLFFILLFFAGLSVGIFYFNDFLNTQHPTLDNKLAGKLILFVALAIAIQLVAHLTRAYKSRLLLDGIRPAKTRVLFKGLSVGFLFNTLLPLRLGEIIRAFYVGDALAISKTVVFISIIIERVVDGFMLGLCFIGAGFLIQNTSAGAFGTLTHAGIGLLVLSSLLAVVIYVVHSENKFILKGIHSVSGLFNTGISNRLRFISWSGIYGIRLMLMDKRAMRRYLGLSVIMWLLYFGSTAVVALAYFQLLAPHDLLFVTQAPYVGVSAPAGPGYIGTFHIIVTQLLNQDNLAKAGGFALLIWLIMITPISLIGLAVLARQRFEKKDAPREQMLINKLYREKDISEEMHHFLDAYFRGEKINRILTQAELDNKFKLIKSFRGGSNAHTVLVWQAEQMVVKKIALLQFADKLEAQAEWFKNRANLKHLPKVINQERTDNHYYFDLTYHEEYYPFFDYIHSHSPGESFKVLEKILRFLDKYIYNQNLQSGNKKQKLTRYIDEKVLRKAADTASISNPVNKLMAHEKLNVNGVEYDNLIPVIEKIRKNKRAMAALADYQEVPIHGDLTVDNLIVSDKGDFLLLDPNNENEVSTKIVDVGKLYQSLHSGYEFLIQLEHCDVKRDCISFKDSKSHKYAEIFRLVDKNLKRDLRPHEYDTILFHEAVHYCRMLTYRANINPSTVPVFYATAVKLFNEFLEQYD